MPTAEVELMSTDLRVLLRSKRISVSGKKVETPRRVLSVTSNVESEAKRITSKDVRGLNEIYRKLDKKKLDRMSHNNGEQKRFILSLRNDIQKGSTPGEVNLIIFSYDNRTENEKKTGKKYTNIPTSSEVEYLCDLLNAHFNDFVIPPLLPYLTGEQYLQFLEMLFNALPSYRTKEVMGTIPGDLHRIEYPPILKLYDRKGIRFFIMDLHGGAPDTHYADINLVQRILTEIEEKNRETCYLQGLNVKYGRPLTSKAIAPARDILSFYYGFDSFGPSHIGLKLPRDLYEKPTPPRPFRLFNRDDYGYYRSDLTGLGVFPSEQGAVYQIQDFYGDASKRLKDMAKIFNAERQGVEAHLLRKNLEEGQSIARYVATKKHISKDLLQSILGLKESIFGGLRRWFT